MGNFVSYRKDFGLIIVGAIIFTASFLWKDLIVDVRELYFPPKSGLGARVVYTILITFILVVIAVEMRNYFGLAPTDAQNQAIQFDDDPIGNHADTSD